MITSYGIILYTKNTKDKNGDILFQLIKRRDSIAYSEFLKNNNIHELDKYINFMSKDEIKRCIIYKDNPEILWDDLWANHNCYFYKKNKEYLQEKIKENINKFIDKFQKENIGLNENNWGFAKGRKKIRESEIECALREFEEETTINRKDIIIQKDKYQKYEEVYNGTDNKIYRSIFYLGYIKEIPKIKLLYSNINRPYITPEVSEIKWCNLSESLKYIDNKKQKILKDIYTLL